MPHDNIQTLREIDEAMARGDMEGFFAHYTEDVKLHVRGNNKLAGDEIGKAKFGELFGRFMEAAGNYTFENHSYLADNEHGIILQTGKFEKDGRAMDLQEVFVLHFRDGKVSEMWYVPVDGAAFDAWVGR